MRIYDILLAKLRAQTSRRSLEKANVKKQTSATTEKDEITEIEKQIIKSLIFTDERATLTYNFFPGIH